MKHLHIILITLGLLSKVNVSLAQNSTYAVVYDFHVHCPEELQEGKVQIEVFKDGINSFFAKNIEYIEVDIIDSITRVHVPIPERINYVRLGAFFGRLEGAYSLINLHVGNNLFLVEDKDTIEVHLYPKKISPVIFKGQQAAKYTLQYDLARRIMINDRVFNQYRTSSGHRKFKESFAVLQHWVDSAFIQISKRLDTAGLTTEIKELLTCDYTAFLYDTKRNLMQGIVESFPYDVEAQQKVLKEISIRRYPVKDFSTALVAKSKGWVDMLLKKEWLKFALERHPERVEIVKDNDYGFANYLAERYTGVIRDKLFYLALVRERDRLGLRAVAPSILKGSLYADAFKNLAKRLEGSEIFDAEMQDKEGGIHRFADYKGKVLVIDMWYTGCLPCLYLAKELKIIQEEMKERDDVVFISLSFDKYKDVWLKTLQSGEYTHEKGVNLWMGEKGMKSPILEHYNIQGVPQLMVVNKDGILVSHNPSRPLSTDPQTRIDFKKLVESFR
ncbi:TlpA family protein disulfide reductase [Sphingobacterium yanglingense]|uniref:Thioredoxin-like protein n=1 Tax=Sphingobacterium yanglingense TaxID=1437280 RepID=A0A4R6WKW4_9SPHI|nr:TlpA disulfide reductase family protein [Sphingobacterium yanglingense]TDQ81077.1 thioredoxin-like protein [Sphingobacterium yanglingense]